MINIRNKKLLIKFGRHLKSLREEKGYTQDMLATRASVPISQIGRIERGEINPTISTLAILAKALKMPLKELVTF